VALAVLDTSEAMGLITKDERDGKLTTVQRFLNSSVVREALGIETSNPDDVTYNRPLDDLKKQLARFIKDMKEGVKVTSRHNRDQVDSYGRTLARSSNISGERIAPLSLKAAAAPVTGKAKRSIVPKKARKITRIEWDKALARNLEDLGNAKLESLHHSICSIQIEHSPLLTIGAWAFVESLAAMAGKHADADFLAFFSVQRFSSYGLGNSNKQVGPVRDALQRLQRNGNTTKHHETSALFDGKQLVNDFATITPLLIKTIEGLASKK